MPWERIYYKSLKVAYLKTQCRRHWMKEGTVSRGVALRPRPTEVQPHFLGSNIYFWNFLWIRSVTFYTDFCYHIISCIGTFYIDFCYQILLCLSRLYRLLLPNSSLFVTFIPTSVTKFFSVRHISYRLLLPSSLEAALLYWLLLPVIVHSHSY